MRLFPQRKPTWTAADVSRFSELLQTEHAVQAQEHAARRSLREAEENVDAGLVAFMDALRERYQQEQARRARRSAHSAAAAPSATHESLCGSCTPKPRAESRHTAPGACLR